MPNANFVFGTNHAFGRIAIDFAFSNGKRFSFAWINSCAHGGYDHLLSRSYVRSSANDGTWFACTNINRSQVQCFFFYRERFTGKDFSDDNAFQSSFYAFDRFDTFHFQTRCG